MAVIFTGYTKDDNINIYMNSLESSNLFYTSEDRAYSNTTGKLIFGTCYGGLTWNYFTGTLDDIAIWDQVLNWDQVEFIHDNGVEYFEERGQIPEPTSMLFALAGIGFAVKRRQRK